jgi:poly(3-hydroxybutyrate) depolymerase
VSRWLLLALFLWATAACDASTVDPTDVDGVFDAPSASVPALAKSAAHKPKKGAKPDAGPKLPARERKPIAGPCVAASGEAARQNKRPAGRPACRRSRIIESRDDDGTPRYACLFAPRDVDARKPLPLVIFLHGETGDPRAVHRKTRLRRRYAELDLSGDPEHTGFVVLAPQARRILKGKQTQSLQMRWDVAHTLPNNADVRAIDRYVEQLLAEGLVDKRQIYAVGESLGGDMAMLYGMLRPDRVAAVGLYASAPRALKWTCEADPPPVGVLYRACDAVVPCADVEQWLGAQEAAQSQIWSMRLGAGKATEPSCVLSKDRCRTKKGSANHERWPKPREQELLEYLSRYSIQ